jgi:hypothetical protein
MRTDLFIAVKPVGSKFAKTLQQGLQAKGLRVVRCSPEKGDDHQRRGKKVFYVTKQTLDKVEQFRSFKEHSVSAPAFTTNRNEIGELGSKTVFARTLINSTSGRGIVEFDVETTPNPPQAPLYTAYIPKKAEYRVHVFNGQVIDVQQKKKKRDFAEDTRDTHIRNVSNGYVYTRNGVVPPTGINELACAAVAAVGYQYGAVDIIYNEKRDKLYVLEVNSRPGLMGTTVDKYVEALEKLV